MVCSQTFKGICCIISAICIHLIIGNVYTWANINAYYVSYIRISQPDFTLMDGFFMVPICNIVHQYVMSIGGYYEKYTGPIVFNIGAILFMIGAHIILYYFTNYWIIMTAMGVFGIGFGIGYYPMMKQCWKYFPQKKGMITGIIICCIGLSTFLFTSLADYMINPKGLPSVEGYFDNEIALRTKDFIFVLIIIISCLGLVSCCLMFPYVEESYPLSPARGEEDIKKQEKEKEKQPEVYVQKERVKEILRTSQFYLLGLMANGISVFSQLATNTNRTFGSINNIDETLLQTLSKVYALLNGLTRAIWGILFDRISFKILYCIVIVNHMACGFGYYFAGQNGIIFFIVNCFAACSFAAHATFIMPTIVHLFGLKNSVILFGMYQYVIGIFTFMNPLLCKFLIKQPTDFLIIYMIGGCFVFSAFVASLFLKSEPYVYTWKSQREKETFDKEKDIINNEISGNDALLSSSLKNDSIIDQ